MKYEIIVTNCSCSNEILIRKAGEHKRWKAGPKCSECGKVLKRGQWEVSDPIEAESKQKALDIYSQQRGY